jgi:hypothetical protein
VVAGGKVHTGLLSKCGCSQPAGEEGGIDRVSSK